MHLRLRLRRLRRPPFPAVAATKCTSAATASAVATAPIAAAPSPLAAATNAPTPRVASALWAATGTIVAPTFPAAAAAAAAHRGCQACERTDHGPAALLC